MPRFSLSAGKRYKFTWRAQSGNYRWYRWEAVGDFIGHDGTKINISFRPEAGTGSIDSVQLIALEEVPKTADIKLPKQLPGAVPAP